LGLSPFALLTPRLHCNTFPRLVRTLFHVFLVDSFYRGLLYRGLFYGNFRCLCHRFDGLYMGRRCRRLNEYGLEDNGVPVNVKQPQVRQAFCLCAEGHHCWDMVGFTTTWVNGVGALWKEAPTTDLNSPV